VTHGVAEQGHGPRDYLTAVREGGFAPLEAGGALSHVVFSHYWVSTPELEMMRTGSYLSG
jgi:hypothetical protein